MVVLKGSLRIAHHVQPPRVLEGKVGDVEKL